MELIKLLGVLIVIVGFALKLDSILIIFLALITTWSERTSGNNRYKLCSEQKYGDLYHDPACYRYS